MLLAGYETTASALNFTIYLLSQGCNTAKQVLNIVTTLSLIHVAAVSCTVAFHHNIVCRLHDMLISHFIGQCL